jgi:very-short-patch-repair endonuclease
MLRCTLVFAGLPEPALNHDAYDRHGRFLGCVDLAYPELRIAIEYHGRLHHAQYAEDVERIAALRAAGWIVIEVTNALFARPDELVARVRAAIASR